MAYSYKGAISFGLVYIPITLSLSIKTNDIGFNMLEKKTKSRIKYKKTCVDCNDKEVKNEDIVKGFQYEKDRYVIFSDEDFEKIKTLKDKNITIEQFVDLNEIDPIYYDKAYYVNPIGATKAYCVLLKAMESLKKAAVAKTVLGTKETLMILRVRDGCMVANTLYFYSEVQKSPEIEKEKVTKQELDLAKNLIDKMTIPFKIEKFKDEYFEKLQKAIKRKISGNEIVVSKDKKETIKAINLMDALKMSISSSSKKRGKNESKGV